MYIFAQSIIALTAIPEVETVLLLSLFLIIF